MGSVNAFTLVELLIVVALIAILAVIALPNFLEAQVRAKVSRATNDLRVVALALEAYAVDNSRYPPNGGVLSYNRIPPEVTTPVAYIMSANLVDPFVEKLNDPIYGVLATYYTYDQIVTRQEFQKILASRSKRVPPVEAVDSPQLNPGARRKYGLWRLVSDGPDQSYADPHFVSGSDPADPNNVIRGADVIYDPTNGTLSKGNIIRTQSGNVRS